MLLTILLGKKLLRLKSILLVFLITSCQENDETDVRELVVGKWVWWNTSFADCSSSSDNLVEDLCGNLYCPRITITKDSLYVNVPGLGPQEFSYTIQANQITLNDGLKQYAGSFQFFRGIASHDGLTLSIPAMNGECTETRRLSRDFGEPIFQIHTIYGPWKQYRMIKTECADDSQNESISCIAPCSFWMITTERMIIADPSGHVTRYLIQPISYGEILIKNLADSVIGSYHQNTLNLNIDFSSVPWMGDCNVSYSVARPY
jgi:hypothetical protein